MFHSIVDSYFPLQVVYILLLATVLLKYLFFYQGVSDLPVNVRFNFSSPTVISVKWDLLRACSPVSDLKVTYRLQYTADSSVEVKELSATRVEASLTRLSPYTNYSIQITTVNEYGVVGFYSYPITVQAPEDGQNVIATVLEVTLFCNFSVPYPVGGMSANISLTNINIYWTPPLRPNGGIIAYEVSYGPADSSDPETRLNTTDLETSFTTQSDLEEGTEFIFSVRAYTRVGPGNTSSITISTLSSVPECENIENTPH